MSTINRSANSGNTWTYSELTAYNIVVRSQPVEALLNQDPPFNRPLTIDTDFFKAEVTSEVENDNTNRVLMYLNLAAKGTSAPIKYLYFILISTYTGQESAIHAFTRELLRMFDFEERPLMLRSHQVIPLFICGDPTQQVQTDFCLVHRSATIVLVVKIDKNECNAEEAEPQVVAAAIAAYQANNRNRARLGLERKGSMTIPCLMMVGTRPVFYIVPVTQELSNAVERGEYPNNVTEVGKSVVWEQALSNEGMENLVFRLKALVHLMKFRSHARSIWANFLD